LADDALMAQVYYTNDAGSQFSNILIYGLAGAGKTPLASTAPNPIIISSEPGLKSLQRYKLPYVVARDHKEAMDMLHWVTTTKYETVFFDSISALSENILLSEKKRSKDPRQFSPATTALTIEVVLAYLSIRNKHVIMTCKATEIKDQITGVTTVEPFAVVPKLGPQLPYHFDDVIYLSRHRNNETGAEYAAFRCRANDYCIARNRSGLLDLWEQADITSVIRKSNGVV
jgi:hypothetical protein